MDIAIDDQCIKEGIEYRVDDGLNQSVHRKVGAEVDDKDSPPYKELQLPGGSLVVYLIKNFQGLQITKDSAGVGLFSMTRSFYSTKGVLSGRPFRLKRG